MFFFVFTPLFGEDELVLTHIFQTGLKPSTRYVRIVRTGGKKNLNERGGGRLTTQKLMEKIQLSQLRYPKASPIKLEYLPTNLSHGAAYGLGLLRICSDYDWWTLWLL